MGQSLSKFKTSAKRLVQTQNWNNLASFRRPRKLADVARAAVLEEQEPQPRFIIHPHTQAKVMWDLYIALLIVYSTLSVPFRIGFDVESEGAWVGIDLVVDFSFAADMLAAFRTGYTDAHGTIVWNWRRIGLHYLRSSFFIDLVSTVPFDLIIAEFFSGANKSLLRSTKLLRALRLIRLLRLFRLLKLGKFFGAAQGRVAINQSVVGLMRMIVQITIIGHLLGCLWFWVAREAEEPTWISVLGTFDVTNSTDQVALKYTTSLYWAFTTMTTVGYGDINAANDLERAMAMLSMLVGASIFGYVVGNVTVLVENIDPKQALRKQKMEDVKEFVRDRKLPPYLSRKVRKHYEYFYLRKSVFEEDTMLGNMPSVYRSQVVKYGMERFLKHNRFLSSASPWVISNVLTAIRPVLCNPWEVIYAQGDLGNEMYFVAQGEVALLWAPRGEVHKLRATRLSVSGLPTSATADLEEVLMGAEGAGLSPKPDTPSDVGTPAAAAGDHKPVGSVTSGGRRNTVDGGEESGADTGDSDGEAGSGSDVDGDGVEQKSSDRTGTSGGGVPGARISMGQQKWDLFKGIIKEAKRERTTPPDVPDDLLFNNRLRAGCIADDDLLATMHTLGVYYKGDHFGHNVVDGGQKTGAPRSGTAVAIVVTELYTIRKEELLEMWPECAKPLSKLNADMRQLVKDLEDAMLGDYGASGTHASAGSTPAVAVPVPAPADWAIAGAASSVGEPPAGAELTPGGGPSIAGVPVDAPPRVVARSAEEARGGAAAVAAGGPGGRPTGGGGADAGAGGADAGAGAPNPVVPVLTAPKPETILTPTPPSAPPAATPARLSMSILAHDAAEMEAAHVTVVNDDVLRDEDGPLPSGVGDLEGDSPLTAPRDAAGAHTVSPHAGHLSRSGRILSTKSGMMDRRLAESKRAIEVDHRSLWYRVVIHPQASRKLKWDVLLMLVILYSAISVPYRLAFDEEAEGAWFWVDLFTDVFFGIDILVNFVTGYLTDTGRLVKEPKLVTSHYLKGWFAIDFLSTFPFDRVVSAALHENASQLRVTKLLRMMRMVRLLRLTRFLKIEKLFGHYEDVIQVNPQVVRMLKLTVMMMFIAHINGCLWYGIAAPPELVDGLALVDEDRTWVTEYCVTSDESSCLYQQVVGSRYLTSVYWAFTTMTTVGYGDVSAHKKNVGEMVLAMMSMLLGTTVFAHVITSVMTMVVNFDPGERAIKMQLLALNDYLRDKHLPNALRMTIKANAKWGMQIQSVLSQTPTVYDNMSLALRREVTGYTFRGTLYKSPIVRLMEFKYPGFVAFLVPNLKPFLAEEGQRITVTGDSVRALFLLVDGTVRVFDAEHRFRREIKDVGYFGESALWAPESSPYAYPFSVRAVTVAQLFFASKLDLMAFEFGFPGAFRAMLEELSRYGCADEWACELPEPEDDDDDDEEEQVATPDPAAAAGKPLPKAGGKPKKKRKKKPKVGKF